MATTTGYLDITEGTEPSAPAAGHQRLYVDSTTHLLKMTNSSGTDRTVEGVTAGAITGSGLTQATARLLGRTTASTGAIEEITVGAGLSLSAGSLTASGSSSVPGWMGWFVGTTDSTNYYWDGNDLAGFTSQNVSGTGTWAENGNAVQVLGTNQTADDASAQLIAQSFSTSDSWMVAVNTAFMHSDSGNSTTASRMLGVCFTDGTATTSNFVGGHIQIDNGASTPAEQMLLVGRHGTLTNVNSAAPWVSQLQMSAMGGWIFIKLTYQAANTFRLAFGPSPYQLSSFGESDISKTMTPTHVGLWISMQQAGTALGMFGPLKKV